MLLCTCTAFWEPVRDAALPAVVVALNAIALWVAWRLRSISAVVQSTSQDLETHSDVLRPLLDRNGSPLGVLERRKSSRNPTIST